MSLDTAAVAKIAKLASIEVSQAEKEHYARELSGILKWIEQLSELNTDDVPQLSSVSETTLPRRKDEVTDGHKRDDILANAQGSEHGCFVVPKVIE
jgi:aspartyl-tRNA(Asn)/glutamyl-tRNA(Gln) amidotransferase subunit C